VPIDVKYEPPVSEALMSAFTILELDTLSRQRFNLGLRQFAPVDPWGDQRGFFSNVAETFNRRDLLPDLVWAARAERPQHAGLLNAAEALGVSATASIIELGARDISQGSSLEKAVRPIEQHAPTAVLNERIGLAEHQIGRVEFGQQPRGFGTAFLIEADLVLTNAHVADLIKAYSPISVRIRFGLKRDLRNKEFPGQPVGLAAKWLVARRPHSKFDISNGTQSDPLPEELDYAVLRLAKEIGKEKIDGAVLPDAPKRNWFDLSQGAVPPAIGEPVFVLGHPEEHPLTTSIGRVLEHTAQGRRIRHDAWTLGGSSGSPLLDGSGRLVGLHHATEPKSGERAKFNQAVPIKLIATDIAAGGGLVP
jgi:hypothetical protein